MLDDSARKCIWTRTNKIRAVQKFRCGPVGQVEPELHNVCFKAKALCLPVFPVCAYNIQCCLLFCSQMAASTFVHFGKSRWPAAGRRVSECCFDIYTLQWTSAPAVHFEDEFQQFDISKCVSQKAKGLLKGACLHQLCLSSLLSLNEACVA